MRYFAYIVFLIGLAEPWSAAAASGDGPWRLANALKVPAWFSIAGSYRARYETLGDQFRTGRNGGDQAFVHRTLLKVGLHQGPFSLVGELQDSRASLNDGGSLINTTIVNPVELLQAHLAWRTQNWFSDGSQTSLRVGRLTMDVGSRRFVARNRYRNTLNAFTGADLVWRSRDGAVVRAFFTLPINRKPNNAQDLLDNEVDFDEEDGEVKFWGLFVSDRFSFGDTWEAYYFGLDEDDSDGRPTRNRELSTVGVRIFRKPALSHLDYQIENALQFGESRSSSAATNVRDLDHFAHFHHLAIGYTFKRAWRPRVVAQYDFASGDNRPTDSDNERFDTLFGARRFEFGPTGIYGPFARSNLNSPGIRLQVKPRAKVTAFAAYRAYWLASDQDTWTTSGLRDATGNSGSFIGHQIEARVRWNVMPKNVRLEAGVAHLFAGEFMDDAPNSNRQGDVTYGYTQLVLHF